MELSGGGLPEIDIVAGGFPCQPFSHAGKRAGTADDRYLWPEMCRIVDELRPSWVFAENVDGLVSMAQSDCEIVMEDETTLCTEAQMVIETIRKDLEAIGYRAIPIIIPAAGIGAMHRRYRILIVGNPESKRRSNGDDSANERQTNREIHTSSDAGGVMAFPSGSGLPKRRRPDGAESNTETRSGAESGSKRCSPLADSKSERCGEARSGIGRSETRPTRGGALADPDNDGLQRCKRARDICEVRAEPRIEQSARCNNGEGWRSAQPGMGGVPYELSDWMDGYGMNPLDALLNFISVYPQPAPRGMPQYGWEPPRVAQGVKSRTGRLKALGNAVDPLQALPFLYAIRVIHEFLMKGGSL